MGERRAAPLGCAASCATRVQRKPFWPVAAQVEEVVEICQPTLLESLNEIRKNVVGRKRPDYNEAFFHSELFVGEIVSLVDRLTAETSSLESTLAYEDNCAVVGELYRHRIRFDKRLTFSLQKRSIFNVCPSRTASKQVLTSS